MTQKEMRRYRKKFGWTEEYEMIKCNECEHTHPCKARVVRYWAQFWNLHTLLAKTYRSDIDA